MRGGDHRRCEVSISRTLLCLWLQFELLFFLLLMYFVYTAAGFVLEQEAVRVVSFLQTLS